MVDKETESLLETVRNLKKPKNAFFIYLEEQSKIYDSFNFPRRAKVQFISEKWRNMDYKQQQSYFVKSRELAQDYEKEQLRLLKEGSEAARDSVIEILLQESGYVLMRDTQTAMNLKTGKEISVPFQQTRSTEEQAIGTQTESDKSQPLANSEEKEKTESGIKKQGQECIGSFLIKLTKNKRTNKKPVKRKSQETRRPKSFKRALMDFESQNQYVRYKEEMEKYDALHNTGNPADTVASTSNLDKTPSSSITALPDMPQPSSFPEEVPRNENPTEDCSADSPYQHIESSLEDLLPDSDIFNTETLRMDPDPLESDFPRPNEKPKSDDFFSEMLNTAWEDFNFPSPFTISSIFSNDLSAASTPNTDLNDNDFLYSLGLNCSSLF